MLGGNALTETTVVAAVEEILRRLRARVNLDEVTVEDGPAKPGGDWKSTVIFIGWSSEDQPAFTLNNIGPEGLRSNDRESWVINCAIGAVDGSTTDAMAKARAKARAALRDVHAVLVEDMTLGGACGRAVLGSVRWFQTLPGLKGPESVLQFDIIGQAL